ncbi:MAG TPA: ABC transporter ATP-binding protein [Oceanospirillales bacterium]|nr:ABC transporter ATP-binding protein [Oceanospirillales bacterium]
MDNCHLELKNISHNIAKQPILQNIALQLTGFQAISLLGPNGAGKSTLLKILAAQFYPQNGTVAFNAINAKTQRQKYLTKIGYMPESAVIFAELTVLEQLQLMANAKNASTKNVDEVISACQLQQVLQKRVNHLSLGYRQRLNLAQAILNKPQLILMDEPLNGLDPHLIIEFREMIKQLKKNSMLIISTHYLAEAQIISDRVLIMQNGQILANENLDEETDLEQRYMQLTHKEVD